MKLSGVLFLLNTGRYNVALNTTDGLKYYIESYLMGKL